MINLTINNAHHRLDIDPDMPLLWAIRDVVNLTGTKFGCGLSQCGACTVHVDGKAIRSCVTPVSSVTNKHITTIEGVDSTTAAAFLCTLVREINWRIPIGFLCG